MLKRIVFLTVALSLSVLPAFGQGDDMIDYLSTSTEDVMDQYQIPGASVAYIKDAEVVYVGAFGIANEDTEAPVTEETQYNVASIAKTITAWGALKLVEEGVLDLDTPISEYLTSWQLPESEYDASGVTIRRILSHTSGLSVEGFAGVAQDEELPSVLELLDGAGGQEVRLQREPGTRFAYSGGGFLVLQQIIADVTDQSYEDYMLANVLEPLGMENSAFELNENVAQPYQFRGIELRQMQFRAITSGGFYTTAGDLGNFVAALMSTEENEEWISVENRQLILTAREEAGNEYGFGVFITPTVDADGNDTAIYWHDGIQSGWRTLYVILPSGEGMVILTNANGGSNIYADILCEWDTHVPEDMSDFCDSL